MLSPHYLLRILLLGTVLLPVFACAFFSLQPDNYWMAQSALALSVILFSLDFVLGAISSRRWRGLLAVVLLQLLASAVLLRLLSYYFQGEGFNTRFYYHLALSSITEAGPAYWSAMLASLVFMLAVGSLSWFCSATASRNKTRLIRGSFLALLLIGLRLEPDLIALSRNLFVPANAAGTQLSLNDINWDRLALQRSALNALPQSLTSGKNLVYIYLESLESIYTEEHVFPALTPNIHTYDSATLNFTALQQTQGAGWTVGGIVASQCGTPLVFPAGPGANDILQNGFLSKANCLGDILSSAGYKQVFMGGAPTAFAGKGTFLQAHGYDEVLGRNELLPLLEDQTYRSSWGLFDDSLFELALAKFDELAQHSQPFNLTLLTLDSHHPIGNPSSSCVPYSVSENSILQAVHCSDQLLGRFLGALQKHPAWADTIVVLQSDHLAMRNAAWELYPANYQRHLMLRVLNSSGVGENTQPGTHMDITPTLLPLLGIEPESSFLAGRNLLNDNRPVVSDPDSDERMAVLRFLNASQLSSKKTALCERTPWLEFKHDALYLAGSEINLSIAGHQVLADKLGSSHAMLALLGTPAQNTGNGTKLNDEISAVTTIKVENLPHVLYQYYNQLQLVLLPIAELETNFPELVSAVLPREGIALVMGSAQGTYRLIDTFVDIATLQETDNCAEQLAQASASIQSEHHPVLAAICESKVQSHAYYDPEQGLLTLNKVANEGGWYSAQLQRNAEGDFAVSALQSLGNSRELARFNHCHAYYGGRDLLIPAVQSTTGFGSMELQQLPADHLLFKLKTANFP